MVEIRQVKSRKDKRTFIYLPEKLYEKRYPQWVHPIYAHERAYFNPKKNHCLAHCDTALFLARQDGEPAGRVMAFVNHRLNQYRSVKEARFSCFDCVNDQEVAIALLRSAERWASGHGASCITGPLGFNNTDNQGILVEGHRYRGIFGAWWHPEYTRKVIEGAGYVKERDWVGYLIEVTPQSIPPVYTRIARRVLSRTSYRLKEFSRRRELKGYVEPVFRIVNETFVDLGGFSPLTADEIRDLVRDNIRYIDSRFLKVVTLNDEVVGFSLSMPDITPGIQRARGRLFPFGFLHVMRASKSARRMDMIVGAILKPHRGKGLDVLMANAFYQTLIQAGISHVDTHQEQEGNFKVRGEFEKLGGRLHRRYRVYKKVLRVNDKSRRS